MSGNAIPVLSARQFSRFDLVNLQRLSASSVGLESVDGTAFDGLTNLIEMDLAENLLTEVSYLRMIQQPTRGRRSHNDGIANFCKRNYALQGDPSCESIDFVDVKLVQFLKVCWALAGAFFQELDTDGD